MNELLLRFLSGVPFSALLIALIFLAPFTGIWLAIIAAFSLITWEWSAMLGCKRLERYMLVLTFMLLSFYIGFGDVTLLLSWAKVIYVIALIVWLSIFILAFKPEVFRKVCLNHFARSIIVLLLLLSSILAFYQILTENWLEAWVLSSYLSMPYELWADWIPELTTRLLFFMFILQIAFADIGAYFFGKRWGKSKIAPSISPGKSWQGLAGAVITTSLLSVFWIWILSIPMASVFWFGFGLVIPGLSLIGDLVESSYKRGSGLKDTSQLLPGHGGIFDRADSHLFAAPCFALFLGISIC